MGAERVSALAYSSDAVPVGSAYGVPVAPAGVPADAVAAAGSYAEYAPEKPQCAAVKKDGALCQAPPIKETPYCIGHKRYYEALQSLGD